MGSFGKNGPFERWTQGRSMGKQLEFLRECVKLVDKWLQANGQVGKNRGCATNTYPASRQLPKGCEDRGIVLVRTPGQDRFFRTIVQAAIPATSRSISEKVEPNEARR